MDCCETYARQFDQTTARHHEARYLRRGLDRQAGRIVNDLTARGVGGARILEVGGGVGDLSLELLKAGAAQVVNVELSPNWTEPAERLLSEQGFADRYRHLVGDFVDLAKDLEPAEVVVLHRVVCCYEDATALIEAAAELCVDRLAMTYPTDHLGARLVIGLENQIRRGRGSDFRVFVHSEDLLDTAAGRSGLELVSAVRRPVWTRSLWQRLHR